MIIERVVSNLKKIAPNFYIGEIIENGQQNAYHEPFYWTKEKGVARIISPKSMFNSNDSLNLDIIQVLTDVPCDAYKQSKIINAAGQKEMKGVLKIPKNPLLSALCGLEGGEDTIFYNPVTKTFRKIRERIFYGQKHLMSAATFDDNGRFLRGQCFSPGIKEHFDYDLFSTKQADKVITHYPDEVSAFAFRNKKDEIVKCVIERGFKAKLIRFTRKIAKYIK